jgi:hypothetical protein
MLARLSAGETMNRSGSHDEAVIEMIRNDPEFAEAYLHTAFEELDEEGGERKGRGHPFREHEHRFRKTRKKCSS